MIAGSRLPIRLASRVLCAGGVVGFPTEGLWGLGCEPLNAHACQRLLALKHRSPTKGLIVLVSDAAMADEFIDATHRADGRERLLSEPGTTWVLPAAEQVPDWLTGGRDSIAMRLTPHPVARALCEAVAGPVVSTSANRSGHVPARSAMQLRRRFGAEVDCVLAGTAGGRPTAIRRYPDGERLR